MTAVGPGDTIGFIGLGRMGIPMSIRAGPSAATGSWRSTSSPAAREAAAATAGVEAIAGAVDAAAGADAVVLMLPSSDSRHSRRCRMASSTRWPPARYWWT